LCMLWVVWVILVCKLVTKVVGVTLSMLVVKSWGVRICGILFGDGCELLYQLPGRGGHVRHGLVPDSMVGAFVGDLDG